MHVSVFEYDITGISATDWAVACTELAPAFAQVPGLVSKVWLTGADGRYGGVYMWADERDYRDSELGAALTAHPHIDRLTMRDWAVNGQPTTITGRAPQPA